MKTTPSNWTRTSLGLLASIIMAGSALSGPSPQFSTVPAAKVQPKVAAKAKCDGCKTTPIWAPGDRSPAGKGAPAARVVGTKHECTYCAATVVREKGSVKDTMVHKAPCQDLLCCR